MFRRLLPPFGVLASVAFLLAGPASAQSADDVAREVQRLRVQIDQERKSIAQDSARQAEWRSQSRSRMGSMRSEAQRLAKEGDSLRVALDHSSRPKAPVAPPVTPAAARKKAFAETLAREIERTLPMLSQEMDAGSELREQWERLAKGLRAGTEEPSEVLGRFLDDLSERIDMGSRIATHPGSHTDASGRAMRGTFVEIGQSVQVFVNREGDRASVRVRGDAELREIQDPSEIAALAKAAEMLSGKLEPGWLFLPFVGTSR